MESKKWFSPFDPVTLLFQIYPEIWSKICAPKKLHCTIIKIKKKRRLKKKERKTRKKSKNIEIDKQSTFI